MSFLTNRRLLLLVISRSLAVAFSYKKLYTFLKEQAFSMWLKMKGTISHDLIWHYGEVNVPATKV